MQIDWIALINEKATYITDVKLELSIAMPKILKVVETLSEFDQRIFYHLFIEQMSLQEVAQVENILTKTIPNVENKILRIITEALHPKLKNERKQKYRDFKNSRYIRARDLRTMKEIRYTKEYHLFQNIQNKCTNENSPQYKNFGAKGIKMYWTDMLEFIRYIQTLENYETYKYLDRIDKTKDFEPENIILKNRRY